ncbi:MAG: pantoate kinase [Thermoplasmata archaeon]
MAYDAVAFCPGHITGFFQVCPDEDPYKMGSRGAGICISHGVHTGVVIRESDATSIDVRINGQASDAPVTKSAIMNLPIERNVHIEVNSEAQLPVSQGFGMSGAGALSSAIAVNEALDLELSKNEVLQAAHKAEVECMTGLGDVFPQSMGGLVVRTKPGVSPYGKIQKHDVERDLVLCIVGPSLSTRDILTNEAIVEKSSKLGSKFVRDFGNESSIDNFFRLSLEFARQTGLISEAVEEAVNACEGLGMASMSMLGNSVFAVGDVHKLRYRLLDFGKIFLCSIENEGAHLVSPIREE